MNDDFFDFMMFDVIWNKNGREWGFDDPEFNEDSEEEELEEMILEPEEQKPKIYDRNSSEGNSREY